ncbi:phospholipid carrier-dependent glycosyltransferase [Novosphingobium sp.]|uniref:phospholipid carrier-dependent glycosyltransferase n=1 Tax=Novosphingobium sp. TaxID=1874826 RepID=UPI00261FC8DD|nr:phospholipid carrier-dependent glycosyltransferase [Novosphingobium sp.]
MEPTGFTHIIAGPLWGGLLVMVAAACLLFTRLTEVAAPIWDEAYNLPAAARVHEGRTQFASHPPLGFMLIALGDAAWGGNRAIDQAGLARLRTAGQADMPRGYDYRGPRLAAAVAGTLAAGAFFALMWQIAGATGPALWLTALFLLDTALLAQFRSAQLDSFQVLFVLGGLVSALRSLSGKLSQASAWLGAAAACIGLAAMVRVNAAALAVCLAVPVWHWLRLAGPVAAVWLTGLVGACGLLAVGGALAAALHVAPLAPDLGGPAGRADSAEASADYAGLAPAPGVLTYAQDYARHLARDLGTMTRTDHNASSPAQWLVGGGAITYRWDAAPGRVATIALVPNRITWIMSAIGMLGSLFGLRGRRTATAILLLLGWWTSMACLVWLDGQRVMYAYHYLIPLLLGHAMLAQVWRDHGLRLGPALPVLLAATAQAALALPLVLHQGVSPAHCRLLLPDCGEGVKQS